MAGGGVSWDFRLPGGLGLASSRIDLNARVLEGMHARMGMPILEELVNEAQEWGQPWGAQGGTPRLYLGFQRSLF